MTHNDIYTKFMIEYDKANVTSSYPSLTEYEVATVLDKAYHALIAQKVTGNNVRRVALEGDLKSISDVSPLITTSSTGALTQIPNSNVVYRTIPEDMLYFVSGSMTQTKSSTMDNISPRPLPLKLVSHQIADKFIISAYNMPWIKTPVCYIEDKNLYIVYDSINTPNITNASVTYIKTPNKFVKDIRNKEYFNMTQAQFNEIDTIGYFSYELKDPQENTVVANDQAKDLLKSAYTFECNDTMAEELISLAVAFALENVESQRLNSKLNMRGLEA